MAPGDWPKFLSLTVPFLVVEASGLWLWIRWRSRIQRLDRAAQRRLAVAAWGSTLLGFVVFTACIR